MAMSSGRAAWRIECRRDDITARHPPLATIFFSLFFRVFYKEGDEIQGIIRTEPVIS